MSISDSEQDNSSNCFEENAGIETAAFVSSSIDGCLQTRQTDHENVTETFYVPHHLPTVLLALSSCVSQHEFGVQDKLYDTDISLMKKLKKIFIDSEALHVEMATKYTSGNKSQFHTHCAKIFKTYLLWLEENQINKMTQQHIILPPQYDHQRLKHIFVGNRDHWTEFIFLPDLSQAQKADCNSWLAICMRYTSNTNVTASSRVNEEPETVEKVKERLFERLKLNGKPLDPPELTKEPVHIGRVDSSKSTLQLLRNESKILQKFAQ